MTLQDQINEIFGQIETLEAGVKADIYRIRVLERDLTRLRDKRDADIPLREHNLIPHEGV